MFPSFLMWRGGYTPPCPVGFRLFNVMRRNSSPPHIQFRLFNVVRRYTPSSRWIATATSFDDNYNTMDRTMTRGQAYKVCPKFFYFHYSDVRRYTPPHHFNVTRRCIIWSWFLTWQHLVALAAAPMPTETRTRLQAAPTTTLMLTTTKMAAAANAIGDDEFMTTAANDIKRAGIQRYTHILFSYTNPALDEDNQCLSRGRRTRYTRYFFYYYSLYWLWLQQPQPPFSVAQIMNGMGSSILSACHQPLQVEVEGFFLATTGKISPSGSLTTDLIFFCI